MVLPFFYQQHIVPENKTIQLDEDTSKHIVQVLRMNAGELIRLTDGIGKIFTARIVEAHKKKCVAELNGDVSVSDRTRTIHIAISPVKNTNRLEWFLEKVTEMGVASVTLLLCQRTEKQHVRYDRLNNILISAMLQSQQGWLPVLQEPIPFEKYVSSATASQRFIAHCIEEGDRSPLTQFAAFTDASILIGPEGDFTPDEVQMAITNGYRPVTLGDTRLRTETAGMLAAALMVNL